MLLIEELERLKSILLHMASNTKNVVKNTAQLFKETNLLEREKIRNEINNLSAILDKVRKEFVNEVLVFIARRQPLGRELLTAHTLISIAYDVYRISRYCREIAKIDAMLAPESSISNMKNMSEVFNKAVKAVENALNDLIELKPRNENIVMEIDNDIDNYYSSLLKEVVSKDNVDMFTTLKVLIMRHIERIVDHANYIENYLKDIA